MRFFVLNLFIFIFFIGCTSNNITTPTKVVTTTNNELMLKAINEVRQKGSACGGPAKPLTWNTSLENAARAHAQDMAMQGKISHLGSGTQYDIVGIKNGKPSTFIDRLKEYGFPYKVGNLVGETVARVSIKKSKDKSVASNFKKAIDKWLNDPPHCKIIMNPRFTDVGVGYYKKDDYYYFVVNLGENR